MKFEILKSILFSLIIVAVSKYALVPLLRKLAETLSLKPKTIGIIAGVATSVPEMLTVSFSAISGLIGASTYNILSSNIINLVQYLFSVAMNKNKKGLANTAIRIDLAIVIATILIPVAMLLFGMEENITMVPIFFLLFCFFYVINHNAHKLYLQNEEEKIEEEIAKETKSLKGKKKKTIWYIVLLTITAIALYFVGDVLGNSLENLCEQFEIPQFVIGILLGFVTSLPELITFFEAQKHHSKINRAELGIVEATNNLLSSNLLNLFIIQSIGIFLFQIIVK